MRRLNQVLLRASLGVLILTPFAYGRSVREDYTAIRSESSTKIHFALGNRLWFSGRSVFLHTEPRAVRGSVHIPELEHYTHISLSHNGHGTGVSSSENHGSNFGSGGNWGGGSNSGSGENWGNGSISGPGGNWGNGSNYGTGGNSGTSDPTDVFLVFGNNGPSGNNSVPEGGTSASYLLPAGFVAFGGIFLAGFRRQSATF